MLDHVLNLSQCHGWVLGLDFDLVLAPALAVTLAMIFGRALSFSALYTTSLFSPSCYLHYFLLSQRCDYHSFYGAKRRS